MRPMSDLAISALTGSRIQERLIAHAWYDGVCVAENLMVDEWGISTSSDRQVQTQVSLDVEDPDGSLAPWAVDDPLGVGGARLQLIYELASGDTVDLGWYRNTKTAPVEHWNLVDTGTRVVWVSGGGVVPVQADDLTEIAVASRLLASESPASGATVVGEVRRLLRDIMPVTVATGVIDRVVPSSTVYERERMDAIEDLLATIACTSRMTADGQLEIIPTVPTAPVWNVGHGVGGVMISLQRSQDVSELYNIAVSEGATPDGRQLLAREFERNGPLRAKGPHGDRPAFHTATGILTTQAAVTADAKTTLANRVRNRTVNLEVTCLPHPGLQIGDSVVVASPIVNGTEVNLIGVIRSLTLRGNKAGAAPMTMVVECPYEDVQAISAQIRRSQ